MGWRRLGFAGLWLLGIEYLAVLSGLANFVSILENDDNPSFTDGCYH